MKLTTKATLGFTLLWFTLSSNLRDPSNPPTGSTGAQVSATVTEPTCQQTGCHSGGTFTGTVTVSGLPDTVVAGTTYTITLTNTSTAIRAGFQMLCLNASFAQCGSFTNGTGTSIGLIGTKQYIRQSTPSILTGGKTSWTFTWTAPTTLAATANPITFSFVSLAANGNGVESGDNVLKSTKIVRFKGTTGTSDFERNIAVNVFPNPTKDVLNIELTDAQNAQVTITDISGKILLIKNLTEKTNKINIAHLSKGFYNAQIQVGGKSISKKIVVN